MKQVRKNVAYHIFALFLVKKNGTRHPHHFAIVLPEQLLNMHLFHHVFSLSLLNTLQQLKKLTSTDK